METFTISPHDFITEKSCQLRENYEIKELIGEGGYGQVRKITHRLTGEDRAVKIISKKSLKSQEDLETMQQEVSILRTLDHPNILKIHETYQDKFSYFIVTELCTGGELFDRITSSQSICEATAAEYTRQILSCLVYCHDRNVVHRDLKPENFLLDTAAPSANIKLIDFGAACELTPGNLLTRKVGTSYYIAPEVIEMGYTEKCDIWSAGTVLYVMLSGVPPFSGNSDEEIIRNVSKGKYAFAGREWEGISAHAKDFISKLMNVDPSARLSAKQALNHPWITNAPKQSLDSGLASRIMSNLRSFHWEKKLQKATLSFIVSQLTTKNEKEEMMELFKTLDKDNNGTLSRQEIMEGLHVFALATNLDGEIDRIMEQVDADGSGEIDYSEFITATMNRSRLLSREKLDIAFRLYDIDGSGTITKDELKAIFGKQHQHEDSFWEVMINEVDKNGDGVIDIHEFSEMMLSLNNNV